MQQSRSSAAVSELGKSDASDYEENYKKRVDRCKDYKETYKRVSRGSDSADEHESKRAISYKRVEAQPLLDFELAGG